jgi:hypothetical protein
MRIIQRRERERRQVVRVLGVKFRDLTDSSALYLVLVFQVWLFGAPRAKVANQLSTVGPHVQLADMLSRLLSASL